MVDIKPILFMHNPDVPMYIAEQLDKYFHQNNIVDRFQAVSLPIDCYGQKPGTSLKIMAKAFIHLHLSAKAIDLSALASYYWGWQLVRVGDDLMLPLKESDWILISEISRL